MSEIRDRAKEAIAKKLHLQELKSVPENSPIFCGWGMLPDNFKLMYRQDAEQILSIPEIARGLFLVEQVEQGITIKAIIAGRRKRPPLIFSEE